MIAKAGAAGVTGRRIHAARMARGWSPEHFADLVSRTAWTVYDWERGRSTPRLEEQPAVADLLGLDLADLFPPPLGVPRGGCGVPGCLDVDCAIEYGRCHCGCGELTARATWSTRSRGLVKGEPLRYVSRHYRDANQVRWSTGYVHAREDARPLRAARRARGWSQDELGRRAGLGGAVSTVGDLERIVGRKVTLQQARKLAAALGCPVDELFTPEAPTNVRASERQRTAQVERPGDRPTAAVAECAELCRELNCWTGLQAADFLLVDPKMVTHYERRGLIEAAHIFDGGPFKARLYRVRDVKRLGRYLWRARRDDHRFHTTERQVRQFAKAHGYSRNRGERLAARARERNERLAKIRVDTGRPKSAGPLAYHRDWARCFTELMAEQREAHARAEFAGVDDNPPPTNLGVALLVAEDDFAKHPGRWGYDPEDAQAAAARRVWGAVKPLLSAVSETRAT